MRLKYTIIISTQILLGLFAGLCLMGTTGCKDSTRAQWESLGTKHKIYVYSGGVCVKTYESTGNVSNEAHSDGYYFEDSTTHKLIEVSGTVVIEQE
jgi:hypothetical protein